MMKKLFLIVLILGFSLAFNKLVFAGDVEVKLNTNDGTTDFEIQDSDGAVVTMVDSNGHVGIGIASPGGNLHILGADVTSPSWASNDYLIIEGQLPLLQLHGASNMEAGIQFSDNVRGAGGIYYNFFTDCLTFNNGGSDNVTIKSGGYVGIGITSPSAKLHVQDSADANQGFIRATNFNPVPTAQWSTFDATANYLLQYALWVGWDDTAKAWKYYRDTSNTRGLTDPGNPNTWTINGTTIGYFDGNLDAVPPGTHINNQYDPRTMAARCSKDDIMVKVGNFWMDKYPTRIINVGADYLGNTLVDDPASGGGNGQNTPHYYMAFSQKTTPSTGMTWFVAQQAAINTGKRLATDAEWQAAAAGTTQTTGNAQTNGRDWAAAAPDAECSRYACYGMAGNIWEWVSNWYGRGTNTAVNSATYGGDYCYYSSPTAFQGSGANMPAAAIRGGRWSDGTEAGAFAFALSYAPSHWFSIIGFRCCK